VSPVVGPLDAARAAARALAGGPPVAVATGVHPPALAGRRLLLYADGRSEGTLGDAALDEAARRHARAALDGAPPALHRLPHGAGEAALFVEAHAAPEPLLVVGAGHIAVPLAELGVRMGFRVTVLDDREEFAVEHRFAPGVQVRRVDFESNPFAGARIDDRTYVALVTRGHRWDFDCLQRLLAMEPQPRYIGMIGSRRRVRAAFHALLEAGVPRARLEAIHAPIGIELGAETPMEIAVSIAAELIAVRRGAAPQSLTTRERVLERLLPAD
jgi:xanthine dehydrogenase accessory factor